MALFGSGDSNSAPSGYDRLHDGVHLYGAICFLGFGGMYWFLFANLYLTVSNLVFSLLTLLHWLAIRRFSGPHVVSWVLVALVYLGLLNVSVHVGSHSEPLVFWGLSLVVAAAFMFNLRGLLVSTVLAMAFYPLTVLLKMAGHPAPIQELTPIQTRVFDSMTYLGVALFLGYTLYHYQSRLKRMRSGLERSEERYRTLFTSEDDAIIIFRPGTLEVVDANPAASRLYGYSLRELMAMRISDLSTTDMETLRDEVGQRVTHLNRRVHRRKDGGEFPAELTMSFFHTRDGRWAVAIIRDITERERAEVLQKELLKQESLAHQEADRANLTKDVFLATLSHELRTPLHAIKMWSELLQTGTLDEGRRKRGLEVIALSVAAQSRIIDDLLDVSRIMAGKMHLKFQTVDVAALTREAVETVRDPAMEKGLDLVVDLTPDLGTIQADPVRYKQILWNLLNNAIKFTPAGGRITVLAERTRGETGERLRVEVQDEGQGLDRDMQERIFEPFTQVDGSSVRVHGGLGLGLTIVKNLVELHGGKVRAESPGLGRGTAFKVELPAVGQTTAGLPARHPALSTVEDLQGVRILAVDDDPVTRQAQVELLRFFGAEVKEAGSVEEAIGALIPFAPHLLLSDIAMPVRDGYDFLNHVRKTMPEPWNRLPAVALTAFGGAVEKQRTMQAGFQAHLEKPVDSTTLIRTLRDVLGRDRPSP